MPATTSIAPTLSLSLTNPKKSPKKTRKNLPKTTHCQVILVETADKLKNEKPMLSHSQLGNSADPLLDTSQFGGNACDTVMDYQSGLLFVGIGKIDKLNGNGLQKIAKTIYQSLQKWCNTATIYLGDMLDEVQFGQFSLALLNSSYRFEHYKTKKSDTAKLEHIELDVTASSQNVDYLQAILDFQTAVHQGQSFARDMANEPPNVCFPTYIAEQAQALATAYPDLLTVKVLGEKDMAKLGMNCFLAVSHGSEREGQLVLMEYNGQTPAKSAKKSKKAQSELQNPIVMVGKGITFDTGGISLKPGLGMGEMKFDMGGAAAVLGMVKALCEARLPLQVVGALACAENMPSGRATRPGDIVTAMNGKTVEILNTDAEGRLVLCDTLVYVQRYQPSVIIDMATLTGAMVVALGSVRTGMFSNDEDVIFELEQASEIAHDRIWHMPLDEDYQEQLNSNMADMQNIGGMPAGSVTAACFLSRFVEDIPWAHLDIAGTAWQAGKEPSGTGRPVPLLMQYLWQKATQVQ